MCIRDRPEASRLFRELTALDPDYRDAATRLGELIDLAVRCLLYTSDAADDLLCVDLGGRRIIKKKTQQTTRRL